MLKICNTTLPKNCITDYHNIFVQLIQPADYAKIQLFSANLFTTVLLLLTFPLFLNSQSPAEHGQ